MSKMKIRIVRDKKIDKLIMSKKESKKMSEKDEDGSNHVVSIKTATWFTLCG